jgi:hypothetical protein
MYSNVMIHVLLNTGKTRRKTEQRSDYDANGPINMVNHHVQALQLEAMESGVFSSYHCVW